MSDKKDIIIRKNKKDDGINNFPYVKVTKYGDHLDIMACTRSNAKKPNCKKIGKGQYVNTDTGEYIQAKRFENRSDNFYILRKSANQLYKLIHMNFHDNIGYHIVLTYSSPPEDTKEVYHDFKIFWQKVRYRYPNMGYISVLEPNQRGVWHMHVLMKNMNNSNAFVSFNDIRKCWYNGFIYISKLREGVDYGNYFRKKINKANKLLELYEPGIKYFRRSRNIKKPLSYRTNNFNVDKMVENDCYKLVDQYSLSINRICIDGGESTINKIFYKFFIKDSKKIF